MEGRSYLKYPLPDLREVMPGVLATGRQAFLEYGRESYPTYSDRRVRGQWQKSASGGEVLERDMKHDTSWWTCDYGLYG